MSAPVVRGLLVGLAVLGGVALWGMPERASQQGQHGGPFALVDVRTGETVSDRDLLGRPAGLFFGFTHCPSVCPTALSTATRWLDALESDADGFQFVFVTVDPERDTPAAMANYMRLFSPRILGLSGTRAQVDAAIAAYGVVAEKRMGESGGYLYDHSASIFLLDAAGAPAGTLDFQTDDALALARLRGLIAGQARRPKAGADAPTCAERCAAVETGKELQAQKP